VGYFSGTFINKTDKKNRVSVPAKFRQLITLNGVHAFFLRPSFTHACLEAVQHSVMDEVAAALARLGPLSPERAALSTMLFAEASEILMDPEGRISIPDSLREFAKIGEDVVFAGLGDKFQLWEPAAFEAYRAEARALARECLSLLEGATAPIAAGGRS
jgi:MraZ protein